jgi:hypothetical protein
MSEKSCIIKIPLSQGKTALVDELDSDLSKANWYATKQGIHNICYYAGRSSKGNRVHKT